MNSEKTGYLEVLIILMLLCPYASAGLRDRFNPGDRSTPTLPDRSSDYQKDTDIKDKIIDKIQNNTSGYDADFNALKQSIIKRIDNALSRLNTLEGKIQANKRLEYVTKQVLLNSIDTIRSGLEEYKRNVNQASTIQELHQINQELIQYLKDNKDIIKENIIQSIIVLAKQSIVKTQEFIYKIDEILRLLKITCRSEIETINEVEAQLDQLEAELDKLDKAIDSEDISQIKKLMKEITQLSQDIAENMIQIQESCLL